VLVALIVSLLEVPVMLSTPVVCVHANASRPTPE
jgi:hypothetical protein